MTTSFGDVFEAVAGAVRPSDPAIYCDHQITSWSEFDRCSNALAHALRAAGLEPGAKVAQYMRNSSEYLIAFAAAFKARRVRVNVNYRYGADELAYLFDNSDAEAVLFDAEFAAVVRALQDRLPTVSAVVELKDGIVATHSDLIGHVPGKLAAYKAPRRIAFAARVPRAPNGKADYAAAKTIFARVFPL